jgi:hypothetical protein
VALWRTSLDLIGHPLLPADLPVAPGWREHISALPTRMWPMRRSDRDHTINWGYLTADIMLRQWIEDLKAAPPPKRLPMAKAAFGSPPG